MKQFWRSILHNSGEFSGNPNDRAPESRARGIAARPHRSHCGPMDRKAVYGQILVVPIAVALFGITVVVIIMAMGVAA